MAKNLCEMLLDEGSSFIVNERDRLVVMRR